MLGLQWDSVSYKVSSMLPLCLSKQGTDSPKRLHFLSDLEFALNGERMHLHFKKQEQPGKPFLFLLLSDVSQPLTLQKKKEGNGNIIPLP